MESKVQLILEQIRRAQANVHNVGLYRKTHAHGSVANAYVRDALKLARGQLLEAAELIEGELGPEAPSPERPLTAEQFTKAAERVIQLAAQRRVLRNAVGVDARSDSDDDTQWLRALKEELGK